MGSSIVGPFGVPLPGVPEWQQAPGAQQTSAPVAGQATSPFDLAHLVQQVASLPQYQQAVSQLGDIYGKQGQVAQQQAQLQGSVPPMSYQPEYEHGAGVGGALRNVGRGILQGLSMTRPAQNYYHGREQQWENRKQALADQAATIKAQAEAPTETLHGLTGLTQAGGMAAYRGGELGIRGREADIRQQSVTNRASFQNALIDLGNAKLDEASRHNRADEMLRGLGVDVQRERNQVILSLGGQKIAVDQNKFDAAVNNKNQGFFDQVLSSLGLKEFQGVGGQTTPVNTVSPALGGGQTAKPQAKPAQKKAAPSQGGGVQVGQKVTLKNGQTITVQHVHPDGSFD